MVTKCFFFWLLIYVFGQNDRETRSLSGQCPLTGRYCEPWQDIGRRERVSPVEIRWSQCKTVKTLQGVSNAGKYFARRSIWADRCQGREKDQGRTLIGSATQSLCTNRNYNIARVLALYKSYWAAMTKIFIYARPCVNKMTCSAVFFFPFPKYPKIESLV